MYESLRLVNGGGLADKINMISQADNTATLCIGIGGTGISALRRIKKAVYETVRPDNYDRCDCSEKPEYKRISFLAIDSDRHPIYASNPALDLSNEFFNIGLCDIVAELADKDVLKRQQCFDWLNKNIAFSSADRMVFGRQIGRYLLCKKANALHNEVARMISSSIQGLSASAEININVISGLSGQTGGGCFIDVCYIVRQALYNLGLQEGACINGFFFMPDVNLANPNFPLGGINEKILKSNGFAALKELDYLMNIPKNGDVFTHKYSEIFRVEQARPPVDMCYLISPPIINGGMLPNGYDHAIDVVSDFVLHGVSNNWIPDGELQCNAFRYKWSVLPSQIELTHKAYPANYVYNLLGASCAIVPKKQIGTYLAIKFFDSIKYIADRRPTNGDVEQFCGNLGIDFLRLDMEIKKGTKPLNLDPKRFDTNAIKGFSVGTISSALDGFCNNWRQDTTNARTSNLKTLSRKLDDYVTTDNPESIIGRIFKELVSITANPDLGPHFATYMIRNSQSHTITSVLAGIREQAKMKRDYAQSQSGFRMDEMQGAQAEFNTANFITVNSKKQKYLFEVENWYRNQVEIETYSDYVLMIDKVLKHLEVIEEEYFKKLTNITDKLILTFKDNAEYFNNHGMGNELPTLNIIEIESIKDQLDEIIEKALKKDGDEVVAPYFVEKFTKLMLSHMNMWFDENETKIAELISNFIRKEFNEAMSKSMKQYLQEQYNITGADLIDWIASHVIKDGVVEWSRPIFLNSPEFPIADQSNHLEYVVLSIPNNEADIRRAAVMYKHDNGGQPQVEVCENEQVDKISALYLFSGIPLYAYNNLIDLEREYNGRLGVAGLHLYESETKDWRNLPSPIPEDLK